MKPESYEPQDFWVSEEQIQASQAAKDGKNRPQPTHKPPTKSRFKGEFSKVPNVVWEALFNGNASSSAWKLVLALQELWFRHPNHYNPVRFTTTHAQSFGFSRFQKYRALSELERLGQITVHSAGNGKNPWVTLRWQDLNYPKSS
jgi:hypothetical protein